MAMANSQPDEALSVHLHQAGCVWLQGCSCSPATKPLLRMGQAGCQSMYILVQTLSIMSALSLRESDTRKITQHVKNTKVFHQPAAAHASLEILSPSPLGTRSNLNLYERRDVEESHESRSVFLQLRED